MSLKETIAIYQAKADKNEMKLRKNPFSEKFDNEKRVFGEEGYGRPEKGSATEKRGIKAGNYVAREVVFLCEIIHKYGEMDETSDVEKWMKFGPLFHLYASYSDKVVGMLIRARKYGLVSFEGEMLYQKQDDDKIVRLLKPIEEIKLSLQHSGDPQNCLGSKK